MQPRASSRTADPSPLAFVIALTSWVGSHGTTAGRGLVAEALATVGAAASSAVLATMVPAARRASERGVGGARAAPAQDKVRHAGS